MKYTQYQILCNAVVKQAAEDYKYEMDLLKIDPDLKTAKRTLAELDEFFEGEQICLYTDLNGIYIRDEVKRMNKDTDPKVDYAMLIELCRRLRLEQPVANDSYSIGFRDAIRRFERGIRKVAAKHRIRKRAIRDSEETT